MGFKEDLQVMNISHFPVEGMSFQVMSGGSDGIPQAGNGINLCQHAL
jgi:hypothetical protein